MFYIQKEPQKHANNPTRLTLYVCTQESEPLCPCSILFMHTATKMRNNARTEHAHTHTHTHARTHTHGRGERKMGETGGVVCRFSQREREALAHRLTLFGLPISKSGERSGASLQTSDVRLFFRCPSEGFGGEARSEGWMEGGEERRARRRGFADAQKGKKRKSSPSQVQQKPLRP